MSVVAVAPPTLPSLPPRTRLYHLAPIGVGTAAVESLTGYLTRLAEAHCVSPSALISDELLPVLRPAGLGGLPPANWIGRFGSHLNGTRELAHEAVAALARLTGRQDLAALTLAPWSAVMASHGRPRRRVWCSACFAEALNQGKDLYEPLLWAIPSVTVCARHRIRLSDRCPAVDCGHRLPLLAAQTRPGHCSACQRVLVLPERGAAQPRLSDADMQWHCWVVDQIGELLAVAPTVSAMPPRIGIGAAIAAFTVALGTRHEGTHAAFARTVGIHANRIHQWRTAEFLPTLSMLLRMSHGLGVSLMQLITGDTAAMRTVELKRTFPVPAPERRPRQPPAVPEIDQLRQRMDALDVGNRWPPLSGAAVARLVGCSAAALFRTFPDEWHDIVMRYRTYRASQRELRVQELAGDIRQAILQLDAHGFYPSVKRILPLLHRRIHPRRADFQVIRGQLLQELGWTRDPSARPHGIPPRRQPA